MRKKRERLILEEIIWEPHIYRIREACSETGGYLFADGGEALMIDPGSSDMVQTICCLAKGLGVEKEKIRVFLTSVRPEELCGAADSMLKEMELYCVSEPVCSMRTEQSLSSDADRKDRNSSGGGLEGGLAGGVEAAAGKPAEQEVYAGCDAEDPERDKPRWKKIQEGDLIRVGGKELHVIGMAGSRREQSGLWIPDLRILFSGDSLGTDPLPVVQDWDVRIDTMGLQFELIRHIQKISPRCILPRTGPAAGVDALWKAGLCKGGFAEGGFAEGGFAEGGLWAGGLWESGLWEGGLSETGRSKAEEEGSLECLSMLNGMFEKYCLRIVETYQRIPSMGTVREEILLSEESSENSQMTQVCLKYLLYRRYIRRHEFQDGAAYERGSLRLTDWNK